MLIEVNRTKGLDQLPSDVSRGRSIVSKRSGSGLVSSGITDAVSRWSSN